MGIWEPLTLRFPFHQNTVFLLSFVKLMFRKFFNNFKSCLQICSYSPWIIFSWVKNYPIGTHFLA